MDDVHRKALPHEMNAAAVTQLSWLSKSAARAIPKFAFDHTQHVPHQIVTG